MLVTIDVPYALLKNIEYVPPEELPNIFIKALEEKISAEFKETQRSQVNYEELVSLLSEKMQAPFIAEENQKVIPKTEEPVSKEDKEIKVVPVIEQVEDNLDDDDDLDDFMDLMK